MNSTSVAIATNIPNQSRNRKPSMRKSRSKVSKKLSKSTGETGSDNVIQLRPNVSSKERSTRSESKQPQQGDQLLDNIKAAVVQFVWLPEPKYYDLLAVYALYTHVYDAFDHAPRLAVWSPIKGSGKSTLLCVLKELVRKGEIRVSATPATLFSGHGQRAPHDSPYDYGPVVTFAPGFAIGIY